VNLLRLLAGALSAIVAVVLGPLGHRDQTPVEPVKPSGPPPAASPATSGRTVSPQKAETARSLLMAAARRQGVDPDLVLAVAWWESGWDQSRMSETGAIGMMQVQPEVAETAGPQLLGRKVDVNKPADNADMGVALLKQLLSDTGGDVSLALADYYQGQGGVASDGIQPDTQQYVDGVLALQARFKAGEGPP
jgi:soluble lytic murein transglycosylase-like protein